MLKLWTSAARRTVRWIGIGAAALLVACGGGGGGGIVNEPVPPVPEVPVVQPPEPQPVHLGSLAVLAGRPGGIGYLDGTGADARLALGNGVVTDSAGNVYVTDGGVRIRRITPQGQVSTWATGLTNANALVMDRDGNFFATDGPNNRILKVSAAGVVSTYAGTGAAGSADGPAAAAQFGSPAGLALAADGTLYVSELNRTIRRISPDGMVSTLAGQASAIGDVDGNGAQARFQGAGPLALDAQGRVIVSDGRSVRAVDAAGNVSTLVRFDTTDWPGTLAVRDGVIYVRSSATGAVLRISGGAWFPVTGPGLLGYADGPAADARFGLGGGMAFDGSGNLYIADSGSTLRKLDTQGMVSTVAGAPMFTDIVSSRISSVTNGPAATARFNYPDSLAQDAAGSLYVSDSVSHTIRKISDGIVSTFAGIAGDGADYPGYNSMTELNSPSGLVSDGDAGLYVVETPRTSLRHIASTGTLGSQMASGGSSPVCYPICGARRGSVVRDGSGGFFISDSDWHVIRRIDAQGRASIYAGELSNRTGDTHRPGERNSDAKGSAARFNVPGGLALDAAGNLYVADSGNNTIRKITPDGYVATFAGVAGPPGDADGPAAVARFNFPLGLAIDAAGNLYVADRDNALLRKITPAGVVSTVAGQRGKRGVAAGTLPATLNQPFGLLMGNQGELYVTDIAEHLVLKIRLP